jgi:hypothetical protein
LAEKELNRVQNQLDQAEEEEAIDEKLLNEGKQIIIIILI